MKTSPKVTVSDSQRALKAAPHVSLGQRFVFVTDPSALEPTPEDVARERLLLADERGPAVLARMDTPVRLAGFSVLPGPMQLHRLGCVVTDRDLYRAEQDTVHLYMAAPGQRAALTLRITHNGQPFLTRDFNPDDEGVCTESLAMLLPGQYEATLLTGMLPLGRPARFTVAEYSLAPLSARLVEHSLDRAASELSFHLEVESYQQPFSGQLQLTLMDGQTPGQTLTVEASEAGKCAGKLALKGDGPFRLQLMAAEDSHRLAQVAIPGSHKADIDETVISELGQEVRLSLMPSADALPVRGAWLTEGERRQTPLRTEAIVAETGLLHLGVDAQAVTLITWNGATGEQAATQLGAMAAGSEIPVLFDGPMTTVFVGAIIDGRCFEGFASFIKPPQMTLELDVPETARPLETLSVTLWCASSRPVPVLLTVRDRRLTATQTPESALAASLKSGVEQVTSPLRSSTGFEGLEAVVKMATMDDTLKLNRAAFHDMFLGGTPNSEPGDILSRSRSFGGSEPLMPMSAVMKPSAAPSGAGATRARQAEGALGAAASDCSIEPRGAFPEVLYYGLLTVDGKQVVKINLPDTLGTFVVEAFACGSGDWQRVERHLTVDKPLRVDLDTPPTVHPSDTALAHLRGASPSGRVRIELTHDGAPVPLGPHGETAPELASPAEVLFACSPGVWVATATDPATGELDRCSHEITAPGKLRYEVRQVRLLSPGERASLHEPGVLSMRVLEGLSRPLGALVEATADYGHLCCEQTAAKILSAVVMYLTSPVELRPKAEAIIVSGIARERSMFRKGAGFRMYPEGDYHSAHYSGLAARYLFRLQDLAGLESLSEPLRRAVTEGLEMALDAAAFHGLELMRPTRLNTVEDAWAIAQHPERHQEVGHFLSSMIDIARGATRNTLSSVERRRTLAWASATLLRMGDLAGGLKLASAVLGELGPEGRLYSTVDSVAAVCMLLELEKHGLLAGDAKLKINGAQTTASAATERSDIELVEVEQGTAVVELTRLKEEDWASYVTQTPVKAELRTHDGKKVRQISRGDRLALTVSLPQGYRNGDLLHVDLPPALSWIQGGARVKRFTLDLAQRDEIDVQLVATEALDKPQHYALCLRNMFEEERAGSPGPLKVGGRRWLPFLK